MKTDAWKKTIVLGPLPVAIIARCLGLTLREGDLVFYPHAQKHAFGKDATRHTICTPHLAATVTAPTHVGQQPKYKGIGFDLVRVVPDGGPIILIGIGQLEPLPKRGVYTLKSVYPIDAAALQRRIRLGTTVEV